MPKIDKILTLEITPEQFLGSCSLNELQEISLLLDAEIVRKANQTDRQIKVGDPNWKDKLELDEEF